SITTPALQHGILWMTTRLASCASPGAHAHSKVQEETMTSRIALVTGGTGGIGSAICERLARNGLKVVTNYRDEGKARAWQERMKDRGFDIAIVSGDVGDPEAAATMIANIQSRVGPVDVLVN